MAQGYLKTGEWTNAITYADRALGRDEKCVKALYRKATALQQMLSFKEAIAVLEQLLRVEPENAAAKSMLAEIRRSSQVNERKEKRMSQKMFSVLASEHDPRVPPTRREAMLAALRDFRAEGLQ